MKIPNERSSATYVFISSWYDFYSSLVIVLYLAKDQSRIIERVKNKFFFVHISYSHPQNDYSTIRKSIFIPALILPIVSKPIIILSPLFLNGNLDVFDLLSNISFRHPTDHTIETLCSLSYSNKLPPLMPILCTIHYTECVAL